MKNTITHNEMDLGGGIDAQSPETNIPASFAADIKDMDPQPRGSVAKRKGFEAIGGSLPLRVKGVTDSISGSEICFELDESVDVTQLGNRPILVKGINSSFVKEVGAETWFASTNTQIKKTLLAGTNTLVITSSDHGFSHDRLLVHIKTADISGNSTFFPDEISIDDTTYDISITATVAADTDVYIVVISSLDETGVSYTEEVAADTTSIPIAAITHQLDHVQLIAELSFKASGDTEWQKIMEETITIDAAGDVTVDFDSEPGTSSDLIRVILRAAPLANIVTGTIAPATTATINIVSPPTPFQFVQVWVEVGTDVERVIPESIIYDLATDTTEVTFINTGSGESFEVYWEDASLESNVICVTGTLYDAGDWADPDVVIWGITDYSTQPESTQSDGDAFKAHLLSTYASQGLRFPVTAIQGSPMRLSADTHEDLFPRMSSRVDGDQLLAPFFSDPGQGGRIESSSANQGVLDVASILWVSGTLVDVLISAPDLTVIDLTLFEDSLTLTNCGWSANEGVWPITSVVAGTNELTVRVTIPARIDSLDDETDTGASAAIYTDSLIVQDLLMFFPNDTLTGDGLETTSLSVVGQDGTRVHLDNTRSIVIMAGGLRVLAVRENASILPLRDGDRVATVEPLVPGDSLNLSGHARSIRIKGVNSNGSSAVTFTVEGENLIVDGADTSSLTVGYKVLLHDSGLIAGEHEILSITSDTTFTIAKGTGADPSSATLMGLTIELDEPLSSLEDDGVTQVTRPLRWFPVSTVSGDVIPWKADSPSSQSVLQGALSRDGLYFSGSDDPVYKFDGQTIGRAGLPRMQVDLFLNKDTGATGKVTLSNPVVETTAASANTFTVGAADILIIRVGDSVTHDDDGEVYDVLGVSETDNKLTVDRNVSGTTFPSDLTRTFLFTYYARLNMVDANGGLIGSAVVGSNDMTVKLGADAAVHMRFHNFPNLDSYDFDRLELQIFRTKANQAGPFYRLTTLPLKNEPGVYVDYTDTAQDAILTSTDLDEISTGLLGVELGTQWEGPIPSKYVKAVAGRLVTANCTGFPKIDFTLRRNAVILSSAVMADMTLGIKRDNTAVSEDQLFEFVDAFTSPAAATAGVIGGLTADTNYYLFTDSKDSALTGCGWYVSDGGGLIDTGDSSFDGLLKAVKATLAGTIPVYVNDLTGTADENWPKQSLLGNPASVEGQAVRRMAGAVNWWQSTLTNAWLTAASGGDFAFGQMILSTPRLEETTFEATWTDNGASVSIFANGTLRDDAEGVSGFTRLFPSRVCVSEQNFPDIFNAPEVDLDVNSRGVADVNPSDGEVITGIETFFGQAVTSNSQQQSTLVVFKESSIYVADIATGEVQKLETEGKGCTVPGSIVSIKGGIMFANLSGIYMLTPQFQVVFVGRRFDRKWKELGTSNYSTAAASLRNTENKYLLTVGETTIVYDTTRSYESGLGSFSTYTNHDAVAWASFGDAHIWSSTRGSVLESRNNNEDEDYSDEGQVFTAELTYRALSFGDPTKRKVVSNITSHFRVLTDESDVIISTQADFDGNFEPCDTINLEQNTGGLASKSIKSIRSAVPTPRSIFLSIRWSTAEIKPFELTGYGVVFSGINGKGASES